MKQIVFAWFGGCHGALTSHIESSFLKIKSNFQNTWLLDVFKQLLWNFLAFNDIANVSWICYFFIDLIFWIKFDLHISNEIFECLVSAPLVLEDMTASVIPVRLKPLIMNTLNVVVAYFVNKIIDIFPLGNSSPFGNKTFVLSGKIKSHMSINELFECYWVGLFSISIRQSC